MKPVVASIIPKKYDRLNFFKFQEEYDEDIQNLYNFLKERNEKLMDVDYQYFLQFVYKEYLRI